jgi:hypothetical protein
MTIWQTKMPRASALAPRAIDGGEDVSSNNSAVLKEHKLNTYFTIIS